MENIIREVNCLLEKLDENNRKIEKEISLLLDYIERINDKHKELSPHENWVGFC